MKWAAVLAKASAENRAMEDQIPTGSSFISIRNGVLSIDDVTMPGNAMRVVVLDRILENDFYEGVFDPDILSSPVCFALSRTMEKMKPHAQSLKPQNTTCFDCPQNQYGSRNLGKGKACQNRVRMALMDEKGLEDIAHAPVKYLKIPPTNLKPWKAYVSQLDDVHHCPTWAVVTEIKVEHDPKVQVRLEYKMVSKVEESLLAALQSKVAVVRDAIEFPYSTFTSDAGPVTPTQGRTGQPIRR
jgi:hypothetical protein